MKKVHHFILFFIVMLALQTVSKDVCAQNESPKQVVQGDVFDLFLSKEKRARLHGEVVTIKPFKLYISAFPFVGYNPALGFVVGGTFNPAVYLGDIRNTPISAFAVNVNFTTRSQMLLSVRSSIFTSNADMFLKGDWRFYLFSQPTYGLGSDITGIDTSRWIMHSGDLCYSVNDVAEPMKFDYIRLYETINKRIVGRFYLGVGYHLDWFLNITDEYQNLESKPARVSQHYLYSEKYGFNPQKYSASGLVFSILYDSRDNSIRPVKGIYACLVPRFNLDILGSSKNSVSLNAEFRTYVGLSKRNPAHLIAFWYQSQFLLDGKLGYLNLPAVGWDTYGRTGRGYVQGRIRGVNYIYGEVEYRFPISRYTRILSGVVFTNASTSDSDMKSVRLFEYIAPSAGAGLRVMLNKRSLSNLTIDMGFGLNGSKGVFLNVSETF
ncbi:MAG: BamA/TamA family outer membrane protein [Bacteroidetes bacterium]|nr:BamA/TamA family outer membrane protein [Bacteroidota bacterium]